METLTTKRNFAQQISIEEYNNQKNEYTEKALLELKSQMATFKPKSKHIRNNNLLYNSDHDNTENVSASANENISASANENISESANENISENESDDASSSEQSASVNVIIKNYNDKAKSGVDDINTCVRRRRTHSKLKEDVAVANDLSNTIYVQRELDLQEIQKIKRQIKKLARNLEEEESKNHFLKLDLCNAQVDNSDLNKALHLRDNKIKQLENRHNDDWWQLITLKIFIIFLVILNIYTSIS